MNRIEMVIAICVIVLLFVIAWFIVIKKVKSKNITQIASAVLTIAALGLYIGWSYYTSFGSYDRYGERYSNFTEVIFFAKDNQEYRITGNVHDPEAVLYFVNINNPHDRHSEDNSFVTTDGYIFFDDSGNKVKSANSDDVSIYVDQDGNKCYGAKFVEWGWTGGIIGHMWGLK